MTNTIKHHEKGHPMNANDARKLRRENHKLLDLLRSELEEADHAERCGFDGQAQPRLIASQKLRLRLVSIVAEFADCPTDEVEAAITDHAS
ncbi:MAG: hypothetical protein KAS72_12960 [Phycisphaerales bacterium]|nr:hypothetical protein [Phycisphaerales bacterium]